MEWETPEHEHKDHSPDWFWAVGIVSLAVAIAAFLLGNFVFGILVIIAGLALILVAREGRQHVRVSLSERGVQVHHELFPYRNLKTFSIDDVHDNPYLILHSNRLIFPHIKIPISHDIDLASLRAYLSQYLSEEDHEPSIIDAIVHFLGF